MLHLNQGSPNIFPQGPDSCINCLLRARHQCDEFGCTLRASSVMSIEFRRGTCQHCMQAVIRQSWSHAGFNLVHFLEGLFTNISAPKPRNIPARKEMAQYDDINHTRDAGALVGRAGAEQEREVRQLVTEGERSEPNNWGIRGCTPGKSFGATPFRLT